MKRLILFYFFVLLLVFGGTAMAQCPFYGEGFIVGQVKMYGNFYGQEDAIVQVGGLVAQYFIPNTTYTDANGFYQLWAPQLPACNPHNGIVTGYYIYVRGGGAPTEIWGSRAPVYFRRPNQGEILHVIKNLPLWYWGSYP